MKHQQVSVDYWAMGKALVMYGGLTIMGWIMMRLFNTVFTLPRRMRAQQDQIQNTLTELQRRFPDMNITEEDLKNAEQELEAFLKEDDDKKLKTESENTEEIEKSNTEVTGETEKEDSDATGGKKEAEATLQIVDKKTI